MMFWFLLALVGQFTGRWDAPAFDGYWSNATAVGPSHDATATATDGQLKQRRLEYRRAREAAERDGKSLYRSDGLPGQPLPKGLYELIRQDGDVRYREVEPAGVPVPKPDAATIRKFRIVGDDCLT